MRSIRTYAAAVPALIFAALLRPVKGVAAADLTGELRAAELTVGADPAGAAAPVLASALNVRAVRGAAAVEPADLSFITAFLQALLMNTVTAPLR